MLYLASETRASWIDEVLADVDRLLIDHANCEKKAASMAVAMLFKYSDDVEMLRPLSEVAREELEHFELMLSVLEERGIAHRRLGAGPYASGLGEVVRDGESERRIDRMLVCALIEARSCERMKLLSEHLPDERLRHLYKGLLASEARHHQLYVDLACRWSPRDAVMERLRELARHEARVLERPAGGLWMHS